MDHDVSARMQSRRIAASRRHRVVTPTYFRIRRNIRYRNSFLPVVEGRIHATDFGSRVEVTMRPVAFVLAFMAVWIGGVLMGLVATLAKATAQAGIPFGMLAVGVAMLSGGFGFEATKADRYLAATLPVYEAPAHMSAYR